MIFQEPKMEYVQIDLSIDAQSEQSQAGVETCTGPLSPSHKCPTYGVAFFDSNGDMYDPDSVAPKIASSEKSATKKSSTTNNGIINGFFDPMGK